MSDLSQQLIHVNHYDLVGSPEEYIAAAQALVARAEKEGHSGLLRYQFFVEPAEQRAGIVITYADADAWLAHHEIAYQWGELGVFQTLVKMRHFDLFGPLNDRMKAFIADAESKSPLVYTLYGQSAGSFVR